MADHPYRSPEDASREVTDRLSRIQERVDLTRESLNKLSFTIVTATMVFVASIIMVEWASAMWGAHTPVSPEPAGCRDTVTLLGPDARVVTCDARQVSLYESPKGGGFGVVRCVCRDVPGYPRAGCNDTKWPIEEEVEDPPTDGEGRRCAVQEQAP